MSEIIVANALGNTFNIHDFGKENIFELEKDVLHNISEILKKTQQDTALVVSNPRQKEYQMRVIERDLSESKMCGNGLRAVGKYFFEKNNINAIEVSTLSGVRSAFKAKNGLVSADLGPFNYNGLYKEGVSTFHDSDVGEPHVVSLVTSPEEASFILETYGLNLAKNGGLSEETQLFPSSTRNLNVLFSSKKKHLSLFNRTFERGVNKETFACGTGTACAANVFAREVLRVNEFSLKVKTLIGELLVQTKNNHTFIVGDATIEGALNLSHVFYGERKTCQQKSA